jgi:hypothetical protein
MKAFKISLVVLMMVFINLMGCQKNFQSGKPADTALETEQDAIRKVVELETSAYYQQDFETWKSTYVTEPYFRLYGYWEGYPEKVVFHNGFESLEQKKKKQFTETGISWPQARVERANENFRIYGEVAWYTFEERTYQNATNKLLGVSMGARLLEKHQGKWKIAYLGFHFLPLNEDAPQLTSGTE